MTRTMKMLAALGAGIAVGTSPAVFAQQQSGDGLVPGGAALGRLEEAEVAPTLVGRLAAVAMGGIAGRVKPRAFVAGGFAAGFHVVAR